MTVVLRRAMLFAAGLGTRLRPRTQHTPKALVPVGGRALIDHTLDRFVAARFERVVVNVHHLPEQVRAHLSGRGTGDTELCIVHEETLLETGGGIVNALPLLGDEPFVSANSDAFWLDDGGAPALSRMAEAYDPARMDALLLLQPRERAVGYDGRGNFGLSPEGGLLRMADAPYVFTGVQVLHPSWFRGRAAEPFSLRALYDEAATPTGAMRRLFGIVHGGPWVHVGSEPELAAAEAFMAARPQRPSP